MTRCIIRFELLLVISISGLCFAQSSVDSLSDIVLSPFQDFQDHCSNCHGVEGIDYDKSFKTLTDKKLRSEIEGMMFGPAFLTPTKEEIEAMVAYNKAIQNGVPFAIVTNAQSFAKGIDDTLRITASPGSDLSFSDNIQVGITHHENEWKLVFDVQNFRSVKITVSRAGRETVFEYPHQLWSR